MRYGEATTKPWLNRILVVKPGGVYTELNEFMAFVCCKKGDIYLAAKYWEILVKLDPEDGYYWTQWEILLNEMGNPAQ